MTDRNYTDAEFEKWMPLVHHVLREQFTAVADGRAWGRRRPLDKDDLLQVGYIALLTAFRDFDDSKATFKTFAYTVIKRAMIDAVQQDSTPVRIKSWKYAKGRAGQEIHDDWLNALKCVLFSEIDYDDELCVREVAQDPQQVAEQRDLLEWCISKLRYLMDEAMWGLLKERSEGAQIKDLAEARGISPRTASNRLRRAMLQASQILTPEMLDEWDGTR